MIKLLITTALTYSGHHKYGGEELIKKRESQYRNFFEYMKRFNVEQYCCECVDKTENTFLNEIISSDRLFYSKTHNPKLKNIGVDEINGCKAALNHFKFNEEDIVIKLTGRYIMNSMSFINDILENQNNFDAFYHPFPSNHSGAGQMFTGAFGLREKYYQNYLDQVNLQKMENEMINVELDLLNYLHANSDNIRLKPISKLDITVYCGDGASIWKV